MANLISKISVKKVCGEIKKVTEKKSLMRVIGIVTSLKTGSSQYGEFVEFIGDFEATNLETGEVCRALKCFLPHIASDITADAVRRGEESGGFKGVEMAFEIGVRPADNAIGYEYDILPLIENRNVDALEALRKKTLKIENKTGK